MSMMPSSSPPEQPTFALGAALVAVVNAVVSAASAFGEAISAAQMSAIVGIVNATVLLIVTVSHYRRSTHYVRELHKLERHVNYDPGDDGG